MPTPSTTHVDFDKIYEPSEDSYLLLDTLSSATEAQFLTKRFGDSHHPANVTPLILEVGTGSGVVLAFVTANAEIIFGREDVLALGTDINVFACEAARRTVAKACTNANSQPTSTRPLSREPVFFSDTVTADLTGSLRDGSVDVLIFNPPYVPTPKVLPWEADGTHTVLEDAMSGSDLLTRESYLLSLSYAGGVDGMEVTKRLLEQLPSVLSHQRGVAYILLCHQNRPDKVIEHIRRWGAGWSVAVVGHLGKQGGWEKLCVIRIARMWHE